MATLPRNIRSRSPRPLSKTSRSSRKAKKVKVSAPPKQGWSRGRASGRGGAAAPEEPFTPTPPPVVVSRVVAPALAVEPLPVADVPPAQPRRSRAWAALPVLVVLVIATAGAFRVADAAGRLPWSELAASMQAAHGTTSTTDSVTTQSPVTAAEPAPETSGWTVSHEGRIAIAGGVMFLPKTFVPAPDGAYDLILHFHGNANIVLESIEHAGLNAVVGVVNWGIRSAPYREKYQVPDAFEGLLAQIDAGVKTRGVTTPKLRRLALMSWSAGYGAIEAILEHRKSPAAGADPLDAVIAIDGVHAAFLDGDPKRLKERTALAWVNAAKAASQGGVMLSMTHSQIDPIEFASAKRTQLYVLEQVPGERDVNEKPPSPKHLALESAKIAVAFGKEKRMVPTLDVRMKNLRVQGFEGHTKEHHIAHLTQMAAVVLPDLLARWRQPPQSDLDGDSKPSSSSEQ